MNRIILIIVVVVFGGGIFIYADHTYSETDTNSEVIDDSTYNFWVENIISGTELSTPAFKLALNGYYDLKFKGLLKNDTLLTVVDFSKTSTENRMFILDLKNRELVKSSLVAHGAQSGVEMAETFSNKRYSNKSSLGVYVTSETYMGKHGYSLRIDGKSKGLNDNARIRAVVIHGANYVSKDFITRNGRLGRSFGCPSVPMDEATEIIDLIKEGSCLYIYHPTLLPISQASLEKLP